MVSPDGRPQTLLLIQYLLVPVLPRRSLILGGPTGRRSRLIGMFAWRGAIAHPYLEWVIELLHQAIEPALEVCRGHPAAGSPMVLMHELPQGTLATLVPFLVIGVRSCTGEMRSKKGPQDGILRTIQPKGMS